MILSGCFAPATVGHDAAAPPERREMSLSHTRGLRMRHSIRSDERFGRAETSFATEI
jgi:hypothetical protein